MISPRIFADTLAEAGFDLFTGVPCSYLTPLIDTLIRRGGTEYLGATNEGDAVAVAAGSQLGGRPAGVLLQNSGLGNAVSPLTSLTHTFHLPVLMIVTWRGEPGGIRDEPQHDKMGQITPHLLDMLGIAWQRMPRNESHVPAAVQQAVDHIGEFGTSYALVVDKGAFSDDVPPPTRNGNGNAEAVSIAPTPLATPQGVLAAPQEQDDVLATVQRSINPRDIVVATTGFTGRALYALEDRAAQIYMVGSMGCASSFGLGLAKAQPDRRIVVLDGDGAFLMRMGAVAMIGRDRPPNLVHLLLDNSVHDSTGGQATVCGAIDQASVATACGYPRAVRIGDLDQLTDEFRRSDKTLTFLHVKTTPRSSRKLPRPTVTPVEVAERLRQWIATS